MNKALQDFYNVPNIHKYEDLSLQSLSEQCNAYEDKVRMLMSCLSEKDRQILETYLDLRNDLETETFKVALRWGKTHYR